ncbi:MAG: threonine/serine dehydratase [Nitrospinaceae bacterium]
MDDYPTLEQIKQAKERLGSFVIETPATPWRDSRLSELIGANTEVFVKLELFQVTGTFKPRGALNVMLNLDQKKLKRGVTAVSAGNHAIATAYAARVLGTTAKVVMPKNANVLRMRLSRQLGAEIVLADTPLEAFARARQIEKEEGRTFIHPFEGPLTLQGTGTAGLEFAHQVPELDAMILPIGGGGLCAGFGAALKQIWPDIKIYGVEPEGAPSMSLSFQQGKPVTLDRINTIADSLAPPKAEPYTFSVCRRFVDDIVRVSDDQLKAAMRHLFYGLKLAVEPAGAAATAALLGPLKETTQGQKVGIIACGTNIDMDDFYALVS